MNNLVVVVVEEVVGGTEAAVAVVDVDVDVDVVALVEVAVAVEVVDDELVLGSPWHVKRGKGFI